MSGHTPGPWQIDWFIGQAGPSDVEYDRGLGKKSKGLKVGDELWRVPISIGPVSSDHDHWAGTHLSVELGDAHLIAAAPDLYDALRVLVRELKLGRTPLAADIQAAVTALSKADGE